MLPTPDVVGIISVCGIILETTLVEYTRSGVVKLSDSS